MVEITEVTLGSLAEKNGVLAGDILLSINDHPISDVLDYRFYLTERRVTLSLHRGPDLLSVTIKKGEYDDIGLSFATDLMDRQKACQNKCVFCFIDQLPRGMRKSLYFKDDDSRMSFLAGSYVTLTNMSEEDIARIIKMKISPIHISVHTTNPALRACMMHNPRAGEVFSIMRRFADAGITMHGQIVLCRGLNDGDELMRTMEDLGTLYPAMESVSVVPIGLTCHRQGLAEMTPFDKESAAEVIAQIETAQKRFLAAFGTRLVYASDEWYLKAGMPLPTEEDYEGYPQLDNGVGLIRSMESEVTDSLAELTEIDGEKTVRYSVATGYAAYDFMSATVERLNEKIPMARGRVYRIRNDFFGEEITVAGLVTGRDLIAQLKGKDLGTHLLLPYVMLRHERDLFLDDTTPAQVEEALGVKVVFTECDGYDFVDKVLSLLKAEAEGKDGETLWENR